MKSSKLLDKTFDHEIAGAQHLSWRNCASDSNKKNDPNQRMATLSLHPSASRLPAPPDQYFASCNTASDMTFLIKTGKWIAVKDVIKFALLKLPNG